MFLAKETKYTKIPELADTRYIPVIMSTAVGV